MVKRRRFTAEFKAKVVLEALGDESSQAELWGPPPSPQRRLGLEVEAGVH